MEPTIEVRDEIDFNGRAVVLHIPLSWVVRMNCHLCYRVRLAWWLVKLAWKA